MSSINRPHLGLAMMSKEHCDAGAAAFIALEQSRQNLMISHADTDRGNVFDSLPITLMLK
ncbi:MAG: hypothetical protein P8L66_00770 [Rhodospirillaceae bacterium]|nr:hypothetical protein [Rhodospirillaceae bacterium]